MAENLQTVLSEIQNTENSFLAELESVTSAQEADVIRINYLSRKGKVTALFAKIGQVDGKDRPQLGAELNKLRSNIEQAFEQKVASFQQQSTSIDEFDPTLPGRKLHFGRLHPLMQVMDEIKSIFTEMGFRIEEGNEIEDDYHNFEALNIPPYHPSRDMQDTFYLSGKYLLRTHTSPVQVHTMENQKPPIRMIAPGRCFRKDTPDASHSPMFHQIEGLVVDKGVSFADLRGIVRAFAQKLFGENIKVRFRPSFFPFTEPSAEYDFSCLFCGGKGCRVCKNTGWLEISGAGMVDPNVFKYVGIDPDVYTGYAFGMGVERIAMLKLGVHDIRIFFENDLRLLQQF